MVSWAIPVTRRSLGIAALLAVLCCWAGLEPRTLDLWKLAPEHAYAPGEALLHGLQSPGVSYSMPVSSVGLAFFHHHLAPEARPWAAGALAALCVILLYALGCGLQSAACGLLAAFLAVRMGVFLPADGLETLLYSFMILLVAVLLCWRTRRPTPRRGLVLGLAVGASLLARSPLFLFPLCLAAWEWLSRRDEPRAERLRSLAPVLAAPVLLLLPWLWMNAAVHGRFIPLEATRADENVVAGALGIIPTIHGYGIRGAAGLSEGDDAVAWAAREAARHPLRYAGSFLRRLASALTGHPLIAFLALAALRLCRGRKETAPLAVLAAYFLAVHCPMGIEPRYFTPLWPILCVLAAGTILSRWRPDDAPPGIPGWVLWPGFALATAFSAAGLAYAAVYPARTAVADGTSTAALDRAILGSPRDPWLWSERGLRRLRAGDAGGAVKDLGQALQLDPDPRRQLNHAWALLARGGRGAGIVKLLHIEDAPMTARLHLLQAVAAALDGKGAVAAAALERAIASGVDRCGADSFPTEREKRFTERLCAGNAGLEVRIAELLEPWPPRDRARALAAFGGSPRFGAALTVRAAHAAAEAGRTREATSLLERALGARPDGTALLAIAGLYARLGRGDRALRTLRQAESAGDAALERLQMASLYLELGRQDDSRRVLRPLLEPSARLAGASWLRAASVAFHGGNAPSARRFLGRARAAAPRRRLLRLPLEPEESLAAAALLGALGDGEGARSFLNELALLKTERRPAAFWMEAASSALSLGDSGRARGFLKRASGALPPAELRRAALLHRELGEAGRSQALLEELLARSPRTPVLLLDLAESALRAGDRPLALRRLDGAAAAGIPREELRRTAALRLELGDGRAALRLYEGLLRDRPRDADLLIEKARAAGAAGQRRLALKTLDRAASLAPEPATLLRLAAAYQQMNECGRALRLLERPPADPALAARTLRDRGICRSMLGEPAAAVSDLEAALRAAPGLHSAALTLGALHEAAGREDRAERVYREALRATPAPGEDAATGMLRTRLQELSP